MTRGKLLFWELYSRYEKFCDEEIDLHFERLNLDKKIKENAVLRKTVLDELLVLLNKT